MRATAIAALAAAYARDENDEFVCRPSVGAAQPVATAMR